MVPWGGPGVQKPWLKQNQPYYQQLHQVAAQFIAPKGGAQHWGPPVPWQGKGQWRPQWQGKGQWRPQQRNPPAPLPMGFQVDANARYTGTVNFYHKWKGYGFIDANQKGVIPGDKVFVHWRNLQSDDRFPILGKGIEVEFGLEVFRDWKHGNVATLRAKNVTMVGGMNLAVQDDLDAQEKNFVGGQHLRYTGTLKFFTPKHGFGYVVMDQGYDVDPSVPSELRVDREEVNAGGQNPSFMENLAVEFGIYKSIRDQYKVYNMTLPGGHPLTQDALENRISMGQTSYQGEVGIWNWRQGWGFIRVDPSATLPPRVMAKLAQQIQAAKARGKSISNDKMLYFRKTDCPNSFGLRQGAPVTFSVYIDDKGAGAADVRC